jgi:hypothetical protein
MEGHNAYFFLRLKENGFYISTFQNSVRKDEKTQN